MDNWVKVITPEIASIIITVILLPILRSLSSYVITYIGAKTDDLRDRLRSDKVRNYIESAEDAVYSAVESVAQTYVDSLKESGSFDDEARKTAFILAKDKALKMISREGKAFIEEIYGDLGVWIENKIETIIRNSK